MSLWMAGLRRHPCFKLNQFNFQVQVTEYLEAILFIHRRIPDRDEDDEDDDWSERIESSKQTCREALFYFRHKSDLSRNEVPIQFELTTIHTRFWPHLLSFRPPRSLPSLFYFRSGSVFFRVTCKARFPFKRFRLRKSLASTFHV